MSVVFFLGQLGEKHKIQRGQAQVIKQEWDKKKKKQVQVLNRALSSGDMFENEQRRGL